MQPAWHGVSAQGAFNHEVSPQTWSLTSEQYHPSNVCSACYASTCTDPSCLFSGNCNLRPSRDIAHIHQNGDTGAVNAQSPAVQPASGTCAEALHTASRISPATEVAGPSPRLGKQMQGASSDSAAKPDRGDDQVTASARLATGLCDCLMCRACFLYSPQDPPMGLPGTILGV